MWSEITPANKKTNVTVAGLLQEVQKLKIIVRKLTRELKKQKVIAAKPRTQASGSTARPQVRSSQTKTLKPTVVGASLATVAPSSAAVERRKGNNTNGKNVKPGCPKAKPPTPRGKTAEVAKPKEVQRSKRRVCQLPKQPLMHVIVKGQKKWCCPVRATWRVLPTGRPCERYITTDTYGVVPFSAVRKLYCRDARFTGRGTIWSILCGETHPMMRSQWRAQCALKRAERAASKSERQGAGKGGPRLQRAQRRVNKAESIAKKIGVERAVPHGAELHQNQKHRGESKEKKNEVTPVSKCNEPEIHCCEARSTSTFHSQGCEPLGGKMHWGPVEELPAVGPSQASHEGPFDGCPLCHPDK